MRIEDELYLASAASPERADLLRRAAREIARQRQLLDGLLTEFVERIQLDGPGSRFSTAQDGPGDAIAGPVRAKDPRKTLRSVADSLMQECAMRAELIAAGHLDAPGRL